MIRTKLYIPREIKDYYDSIGTLQDCLNRLIEMANEASLWEELVAMEPARGDREVKVTVTVDNPEYEQYRQDVGPTSKSASLKRLLVYGYENELLSDYAAPAQQPREDRLDKRVKLLWVEMCNLGAKAWSKRKPWARCLLECADAMEEYL